MSENFQDTNGPTLAGRCCEPLQPEDRANDPSHCEFWKPSKTVAARTLGECKLKYHRSSECLNAHCLINECKVSS